MGRAGGALLPHRRAGVAPPAAQPVSAAAPAASPLTTLGTNISERRLFAAAGLVFGVLHLVLAAGVGLWVVDWSSTTGPLLFAMFELLFVGVAYTTTEMVMCFALRPREVPRLSRLRGFPPVALVMTVC